VLKTPSFHITSAVLLSSAAVYLSLFTFPDVDLFYVSNLVMLQRPDHFLSFTGCDSFDLQLGVKLFVGH
jgi:hypothetical protein